MLKSISQVGFTQCVEPAKLSPEQKQQIKDIFNDTTPKQF